MPALEPGKKSTRSSAWLRNEMSASYSSKLRSLVMAKWQPVIALARFSGRRVPKPPFKTKRPPMKSRTVPAEAPPGDIQMLLSLHILTQMRVPAALLVQRARKPMLGRAHACGNRGGR